MFKLPISYFQFCYVQLAAAAFTINSLCIQVSLGYPPSAVCDRGTLITGMGNNARRDGHVAPGGQASGGRYV